MIKILIIFIKIGTFFLIRLEGRKLVQAKSKVCRF